MYDSMWIHGYKLGRILSELKIVMAIEGEKNVRKLCPGATDEMLEDLRNAGKSFDADRAFTKKYKRILVETDMYKELGEEARQALREEEEQEAVKSLMNEAAGFLVTADEAKVTKKALKRKVPIALYSSVGRDYILPKGFKKDELKNTEVRIRLAKHFLRRQNQQWSSKEEAERGLSDCPKGTVLRSGNHVVITGEVPALWKIEYVSRNNPWYIQYRRGHETVVRVRMDPYGRVSHMESESI
mgnify:FL=1